MKKLLIAVVILLLIACATFWPTLVPIPGTVTIIAQSLPITRTLAWDANATSDMVTNYVVRQDSVIIGSPTGTTQPITITTLGTHTFAVRAVSLWGESVDSLLIVNVVLPSAVRNVRIQ